MGAYSSCARKSDGSGWCWGGAVSGVAETNPKTPGLVIAANVREIRTGGASSCAIVDQGTLQCTGANDAGQLGDPALSDPTTQFTTVSTAAADQVHVAMGGGGGCIADASDVVRCFGAFGNQGALGNGALDDSPTPVVTLFSCD
jgi:alpha-tubulin suppressor-like RCC1 family protein